MTWNVDIFLLSQKKNLSTNDTVLLYHGRYGHNNILNVQ